MQWFLLDDSETKMKVNGDGLGLKFGDISSHLFEQDFQKYYPYFFVFNLLRQHPEKYCTLENNQSDNLGTKINKNPYITF